MMTRDEIEMRISRLSGAQRKLLAGQLAIREQGSGEYKGRRVIAYVAGDPDLDAATLRDKLKGQLPAHMIPAAFVMMKEMPRLPNGKVNHSALPAANDAPTSPEASYLAPRLPVEQQLATIWEDVLGIHPVGIHDNFFEIGGDSILSIQIVARARKAGLVLGPNQLFEHQTIAELSLFIQPPKEDESLGHSPMAGPVPMTPIQQWFFEEHKSAPHHWNQVMAFTVTRGIQTSDIARAMDALLKHHDALRLNFSCHEGKWEAIVRESAPDHALHNFDLRNHREEELDRIIANESESIQRSFSLSDGALFQALFFECEPVRQNQLILVAHHLLVDAVSWQIISEDLRTLLGGQHKASSLTRTTSYQAWSAHLTRAVELRKFDSELSFWQSQEQQPDSIPTDLPMGMPVTEDSIETVSFELDPAATSLLLKEALAPYHMRPDEILVTALLQAAEEWCGLKTLTLWFERHGRQSIAEEIDLSSTVGWFTAFYPLKLSHDPQSESGATLKHVKEQLRQVPNGGVGYGALRYLGDSAGYAAKLNGQAGMIFNYLGNQTVAASGPLTGASMIFAGSRAPKSERNSLLEINCYIQDGQLQMRFSFSKSHYHIQTIERLINKFSATLRGLIDHCVSADGGGYTPSDFPEAGLSQEDLDALLNKF